MFGLLLKLHAMIKNLIIILMLLLGLPLSGQNNTIPSEPSEFFKALPDLMGDGTNTKEIKDYLKSFQPLWESDAFSEYRNKIIMFSQEMMKRKLRSGHFRYFIQACESFHLNSGQPFTIFDEWLETIRWGIKHKSPTSILQYLQFSYGFFARGDLYSSGGHTWSVREPIYSFTIEDKVFSIQFKQTNLYCDSRMDSLSIEQGDLVFFPYDDRILVSGGYVYFDRLKLSREQVYAELNKTEISVRRNNYISDSVLFVNTLYFSDPLMGSFEDKLTATSELRDSRYPKFESYTKRFVIEELMENIDYEGGFAYYGNRFIARGDSTAPAKMFFKRDGKVFIRASASSFAISEDKITGNPVSVVMYLGEEDSMYHPSANLRFLKEKKEFSLLRIGEGVVQTPFFNTYHKIDMFFEALYWNQDEDLMRIAMAKGTTSAVAKFRSERFFSEIDDERLRGYDEVHPITHIFNFLKKKDHPSEIDASELSVYMRTEPIQVRGLLTRMSIGGLLSYDSQRQRARVTERFYNYHFSRSGRLDYDVIQFSSEINTENALLSLKDWRLDMQGVARITLSDSQSVFIYPTDQRLTLKKNRDFIFDGMIEAGKFGLYGKNFAFSYDLFKIDLVDVDSVKLAVESFKANERGERPVRFVKTVITGMTGELLIDEPGNKSGMKGLPEYPRLISKKDSYAYYDRKEIEEGVYDRNLVYFKLNPFEIDSLDNFSTEQIRLSGTFVSGGIFPDIEEQLRIMPDYSLGFQNVAPEEGYPVYEGKGTYFDTLSLSHNGIRGSGQLDYLSSSIYSYDFKFYPDSMNTMADKFGIRQTRGDFETPDVKAAEVYVHWEPENDFMDVSETTKPLEMYNGETRLHGSMTLTPEGLVGKGMLDFGNAEMNSDKFKFRAIEFTSDTTSFALKDIYDNSDTSQVAFSTANVKADVSFEGRVGKMVSNSSESFVDFPLNSFKAYMEELEWYMDKNEVDMNSTQVDRLGLKGALFVSTDRRLDSLAFVAPVAKFVLKTKTIACEGVEYIDVADSRIFPLDRKLNIQRNAKIDPIPDATIWVNRDKKLHIMEKGNISIFTRHRYTGTAEYTYVDEVGKAQRIFFNQIDVENKTDVTIAVGKIEQTTDFTMSPHFQFKGSVALRGDNEFMRFNGYTRVIHPCGEIMRNDWLKFENEIDPNNIMIPIPAKPQNDNQVVLHNGFMFAADSTGLYPAIFSLKKSYTDYEVLRADGFLVFDKSSQEFRISRREKLEDRSMSGAYISFDASNCTSYGEGRMDLGSKMGQVELKAAGSIYYYPQADSTKMNLVMSIHFPFEESALKFIKEGLISLGGIDLNLRDDDLRKDLSDLLDSTKADKAFSELRDGKFRRIPREFDRTFILSGIELSWNKKNRALMFEGSAGIVLFNGDHILKTANVLFELNRKPAGDIFTFILEIDESDWYFFQYRTNVLRVFSSKKDWNEIITSLDPKKRNYSEKGQPNLSIQMSSQRQVDRFRNKFNAAMAPEPEIEESIPSAPVNPNTD
jgi:hypothetical protein